MDRPLLRMTGIHKRFPGVHALRGVDLELHAGEVLALVGENGAGKSTLIKTMGGAHRPDAGRMEVDGVPLVDATPQSAQRAGIGIIYQELNLAPAMRVRDNIFLGHERSLLGWIRAAEETRRARELFDSIGVDVDPDALCRNLSIAEQQVVEIAKALSLDAKIIVMDEPTAALTPREVERLLAVVRELKSRGIGIIYVSHRLNEVLEIADRVTVLRDGATVGERPIEEMTREQMIEMMVGRKLEDEFPPRDVEIGEPRLVVEGLTREPSVRDVSLSVKAGEIVALTGLVGSGRTETARLLFGADRADGGQVRVDGEVVDIRRPRHAIAAGVCLLTEDRKSQGLVLRHSVLHNFGLPNLAKFARLGVLDGRREANAFDGYVDQLEIRIASRVQRAETLSGGNQQKVVLAKWLQQNAKVIVFDEPTRGIDVGAKQGIYALLNGLAAQGKAILMISSELPEVLGMADRILVMHEGRVTGEIEDVAEATQQQIMELAVQ